MIKSVISDFQNLLFPDLCYCCEKEEVHSRGLLCPSCILNLPYTDHFIYENNNSARKLWGRIPSYYTASYLGFSGYANVRSMMHRLKYRRQKHIGFELGKLAAKKALQHNKFADIDIIIPVPLHPIKQKSRGYNQSELIADGMAEILNKPVHTDLLLKISHTPSQTKKGRLERVKNVYKSFQLTNFNQIQGKHILIVDDVITTGATIEACAMKLLECSGTKISIFTLCVARN